MIAHVRPVQPQRLGFKSLLLELAVFFAFSCSALAVQIEYTQNVRFETTKKQSLFGPGDAGPPLISEYPLTVKWAPPVAPDPLPPNFNPYNININVGDANTGNGLLIQGRTSGEIGLNNVFKFDPGGINVALDYDVTMTVPDYVKYKSGDFEVQVLAPKLNKGSFNTTSPRPEFYSELILQGSAIIDVGKARFKSPWSDEPYASTFNNTVLVNNFKLLDSENKTVKVVTFNAPDPEKGGQPDGQLKLLPILDTLKKAHATAKLLNEVDKVEGVSGKVQTVGEALKFSIGPSNDPMVSASFKVPYIELNSPNLHSNVRLNGHDQFADLRVNLVKLATTVAQSFGLPVPELQKKASLDFVAGSASVSASVIEANFTPRLELTQKTGVDATGILAKFNFGREVNVGIKGVSDPTPKMEIDIRAGQTLVFREDLVNGFNANVGPADINLAPIFEAQPQLFNQFGIAIGASIDAAILKGSIKGDLLGFDLLDKKFAAIESEKIDLGLSEPFAITNREGKSFTMTGFQPINSSPLLLTVSPLEWANNSSGNWYDTAKWTPTAFPDGKGVTISSNSNIEVEVGEPGGAKLRRAENLTVRGNALLKVLADVAPPTAEHDKELKIGGNIQLAVNQGAIENRRAGILIQDKGTVLLTKTVGDVEDWTWKLSGPGLVRLNGNDAEFKVQWTLPDLTKVGSLNVLGGGFDGFGKVNVEKSLILNEGWLTGGVFGAADNATKQLNVSAESVSVVGSQYASVIGAAAQGKLKLTTADGLGITRDGGTEENRVAILASPRSEVHLEVSKIDSARFISRKEPLTTGTEGKIYLDRAMELKNIVNDGIVEASQTITLKQASPAAKLENNGVFLAKSIVQTSDAITLSGTGRLNLQQQATLKLNGGAKLVNGPTHTIAAVFPGASKIDSLPAAGSFVNQGRLYANEGTLQLAAGSFRNDGLFEAGGFFSSRLEMTGNSTLENLTKNGDGDPVLTAGRYRLSDKDASMSLKTENASTKFLNQAQIELFGERPNETSGFEINGTDLRNMQSMRNDAAFIDPFLQIVVRDPGQITLGNARSFLTNNLINDGVIILRGSPNGKQTKVGKVTNNGLVQATIASEDAAFDATTRATLQLAIDDNKAVNNGTIRAVKDRNGFGSIELTVESGGRGNEHFENNGVVEVRNAQMKFQGLNVNHGSGNRFERGRWVVEGMPGFGIHSVFGETDIPNVTTLNLDLPTAEAPTVLAADVQFIGQNSHVLLNNKEFEQTIDKIDSAGILSLTGRSMTFSKDLTNEGMLVMGSTTEVIETPEKIPPNLGDAGQPVFAKVVTNKSVVTLKVPSNGSVGLTNKNTIMGSGEFSLSPDGKLVNEASGMIVASDGELTFELGTIQNAGKIIALGPNKDNQNPNLDLFAGAIGLKNAKIDGGVVEVHDGGALVGHGELLNTVTLTNNGLVVTRPVLADLSLPLTIGIQAGNKNVKNRGQMVATNGGTMVLKSPDAGGDLDNVGGMVVILPNADDSGPPNNFINGKIQLLNTTVDNGIVSSRGVFDPNRQVYLPGFGFDPIDGKSKSFDPTRTNHFARLTGRDATLDKVIIDIDSTAVVADTASTPAKDNSFQIVPLAGSVAKIIDSFIVAVDGGTLSLVGTGGEYQLFGTNVIAGASQGVHSTIEFKDAIVRGGTLKTDGGGEIHITGTSRFINASSQGEVTVDANQTLQLAGIFNNESGTLQEILLGNGQTNLVVSGFPERGTLQVEGTLLLDGATPIGGDFNILSGSDLLAGTLNVTATGVVDVNKNARILGAHIQNAGMIRLNGDDDLLINESANGTNPSNNFMIGGKIRIADSAKMRVRNQKMTNTGDVRIEGTGQINVATYGQTMGTTMVIDGGKIVGNMELSGGTLGGTGQVTGMLDQSGGIVSPGLSPGTLTVGGDFNQTAGKYFVEIAALSSFDHLAVGGAAALGGGLEWVLSGGYMPDAGSLFRILSAQNGVTGRFNIPAPQDLPTLAPGLYWNVFYGPKDVILQVLAVPEPASLVMCLGMMAVAVQFASRGRRR